MISLDEAVFSTLQNGFYSLTGSLSIWMGVAPETATYPFVLVSRLAGKSRHFLPETLGARQNRYETIEYQISLLSTTAAQGAQMEDDAFNMFDSQDLILDNGGTSGVWAARMPSRVEPMRDATGSSVYLYAIRLTIIAANVNN